MPRLVALADLSDRELAEAYQHDPGTVRANMITSLDGAVSVNGLSGGLSGAADRRVFRLLRAVADVVLVGAGTVAAEDYRAGVGHPPELVELRSALGLAPEARLAIWSPRLSLQATSRVFGDRSRRPLVFCTAGAPAERRAGLADRAELVVLPPGAGPDSVVAELTGRGLVRLLCEGGPLLLSGLLAADAVHELCLTVSPLTVGPGAGRIVAGHLWTEPIRWTLEHLLAADSMVLARYRRAPA